MSLLSLICLLSVLLDYIILSSLSVQIGKNLLSKFSVIKQYHIR